MREILFRGKATRTNLWVYGYYTTNYGTGRPQIREKAECCFTEVIPETVGQYTGLTDKNGKKIFEGDIVKAKDGLSNDLFEFYGYVDHKYGSFVIVGECITHFRWLDYDVEVIGNIHDNPEFLKDGGTWR